MIFIGKLDAVSFLGDSFISRKTKSSIEKKEIIKKALDSQSERL